MDITNEELTVTPFIEVDAKDGRIEKRPLQVAGALTLPAADVVSLFGSVFNNNNRGTYNLPRWHNQASHIRLMKRRRQKSCPMGSGKYPLED
jgi:hypothetical protein